VDWPIASRVRGASLTMVSIVCIIVYNICECLLCCIKLL